jgi:hypothetical protein
MGMLIICHKVKDTINGARVRPARQSARVGWPNQSMRFSLVG